MDSKNIGSKIAQARKKVNISQAQLAEHVFVSPQAVGKWERGESMPDIPTLNRVAEILGVDLNYFSENFPSGDRKTATHEPPEETGFFNKLRNTLGLHWNMSGENYVDADFSGIKNIKDKLDGSSFKKCKLIESDLSDITFRGNSIKDCDFLKANLRNCKFYGSEIRANSFEQTSFIDAVVEASEIRNCNFTNANLSGLEINTSELRNNIIENVVWKHTSIKETQLTEMVFSGLMEDCTFSSCAFSKTIFKNAVLKNSFFKYCDLKRVEFTDCQADKLTYAFLKNGKANLVDVTIIDE